MEEKEIFEKLENILKNPKHFDQKKISKKITSETNIWEEFKFNIIDIYEFIYALEEEFRIAISDERVSDFQVTKNCVDYIKNNYSISA